MKSEFPVHIERGAIPSLIRYCQSNGLDRLTLVADRNTYAALGEAVEDALARSGVGVNTIVLSGEEVVPDERRIVEVLVRVAREERFFLAVGSGTITDIVRFVSHRTKSAFISVPTAPSVDGYTSIGASLIIGRLKQTVYAHPPVAVFADLETLRAAPRPMIAAGFGDILGKYTALADWRLGHLLWDEPYSQPIAHRVRRALQDCADRAEEIGRASAEGMRSLMEALVECGLCMLDFGASPPASGAEHYLSHFWEMKLLQEGRPAILHGAKVGVSCILVADYYDKIRQLTREQAAELLNTATRPDRQRETQRIRAAYGPLADEIIAEQAPFLDMPDDAYARLKQRVIDHWAEVQDIAALVPPPQELVDLLRTVGGPVDPQTLGLSDEEVTLALERGHYLRNRFTVLKLSRLLGIMG